MRAQGGELSALPPHTSKKRKYSFDLQSPGKGASSSSTRPKTRKVVANTPPHGVEKGLMTSQGPVTTFPLPLLVKDKEYAVDTARSIIWDADLDECLEHETKLLGDSSLHDDKP